jgi:hypothetical protein
MKERCIAFGKYFSCAGKVQGSSYEVDATEPLVHGAVFAEAEAPIADIYNRYVFCKFR